MAYPVYQDNGGIAAADDFSVDVPYPGTVNADDILIVALLDADNDTFTVPSNWYLIKEEGTNANCSVAWMWKRASGSETGTETFTSQLTAGSLVCGVMYRFSGCVTSGTPYEDANQTAVLQETTYTRPAVTTTDNERLGVCIVNVEDNMTVDPTTNWTERSELLTSFGSDGAFELQDKQIPSATTENADTASIGGDDYHGVVVFALLPTGAGNDLISGQTDGITTVSGTIKGDGKLTGQSDGTTTDSGILKGAGKVQGQSDGVTTCSATGFLLGFIDGSSNGVAVISGIIKGSGKLFSQSDGASTISGDVKGKGKLLGQLSGLSIVEGNCVAQSDGSISGVINGVTTLQGSLKGNGKLIGQSDDVVTVTATLIGKGNLSGLSNGITAIVAALTGIGNLASQTSGVSDVLAILKATGVLAGITDGVTLLQGSISGTNKIQGQSSGVTSVLGILKAIGELTGQSDGVSFLSGRLRKLTERHLTKSTFFLKFKI